MGNRSGAALSAGSARTTDDEAGQSLVGAPVGLVQGEHGVEEHVSTGQAATYPEGILSMVPSYCYLCLCWPISLPAFLISFVCQLCSPCAFCCLGNAWCQLPVQINYTHALTVIQHQIKETCLGWLCCFGWLISVQPGILVTTLLLRTPPKYLYDEDRDDAYVMTFADYVEAKRQTFPPFSGKYRAIDGGGNHAYYTFLGQGGRGYASNEPFIIPTYPLPDPDKMQTDLQMRVEFKEAPWGLNSLACWFANIAIHEFFRSATGSDGAGKGGAGTDMHTTAHAAPNERPGTNGVDKPWVNLHSGYLDLQTLYGYNQQISDSIREFRGGKITKVAENRLSRVPESLVILKLLMMEHNWVCDQLAAKYPGQFDTDEKLFQQARLIMGGVFINLVLRQYGDQVFGESAPNGKGFAELRQDYGYWPMMGRNQDVGNHSSFAFNLIYRWHTGIPDEWTFASANRKIDTKEEMKSMFSDILNWKAGGFGPNNMPKDLFKHVVVPAAAVRDARQCGAPRLNDFTRRFNMAYSSFEDLCGNAELAAKVAKYYNSIEDVELSVGLQIERCSHGGWSLPRSVFSAIVGDAFNSIRQDRFYTTDYTAEVYTEWGLEHTKSTNLVDLLNRHLDFGLDRNMMLSRVPGWKGSPKWNDFEGFPFNCTESFDIRGFGSLTREPTSFVAPSDIV